MITGITTAPPIKVVVPHTHVSKPFELAPTSLSPVQSSEDTQITLTAAIAIFNLAEENRELWSSLNFSHLLESQTSLATCDTATPWKAALLKQNNKEEKEILLFVTQYKPLVSIIKEALMKKCNLIQNQPLPCQSFKEPLNPRTYTQNHTPYPGTRGG